MIVLIGVQSLSATDNKEVGWMDGLYNLLEVFMKNKGTEA